jgi:hypothetical protein
VSGNIVESLGLFNNVLLIELYHIRLSRSVESDMSGILNRYIRHTSNRFDLDIVPLIWFHVIVAHVC